MAVTTIQEVPIQASPIGENFFAARDVSGPAAYAAGVGGGQVVSATFFGLLSGIRWAGSMGVSSDGNFLVEATTPTGSGAKTIKLRWYVSTTGAEVGNGTNLSGSKCRIGVIGN